MPYFAAKDATGATIYLNATGSGTTVDPYVPTHTFTNALPAGTAVIGKVDQGTGGASAWKVDGSAVTQPVSIATAVAVTGTFWQATQPVSAASLPLPTGAATSANQATSNTSLASIDAKLPTLASGRTPVDGSAVTQPVSATSLPLPTGAATASNQATTNTSIASLDTKTPTLGQALAAASSPVVLPAAQITTLTPPAAITGFALDSTLAAQSAKLPATLGTKTSATSLGVVLASDQAALPVVSGGNVAASAADSGNPIKIGGKFNTTPPTLTDGQRGDVQLDNLGRLLVSLATRLDAANDSVNIGKIDGTLPDAEFTILASAARTATNTIDIVRPVGARGLVIWFDITAVPGTDTVTLSLVGRDALTTGKTKTISAFTAQAAATTAIYQIYPAGSLGGSYTQSSPNVLPRNVRVTITHSAATSFTYAIGGCWVS